MLSEGRVDTDDIFSINDGENALLVLEGIENLIMIGILRLLLSRESYEKAGLIGQRASFMSGRKGQRWCEYSAKHCISDRSDKTLLVSG